MIPNLEKATALRAVPLFADLGADELLALAALSDDLTVGEGARIFAEGEPGDALFVVVEGRVRVERKAEPVAELDAGECFGELALLDDGPRSATVVAAKPTELLRIGRDDFLDTLSMYPAVGRAVLQILARRLRGDGDR